MKSGGFKVLNDCWVMAESLAGMAAEIPGYVRLEQNGMLWVFTNYLTDGASGPAYNNKTILRGAVFHDAGYQLLRQRKIHQIYRKAVDRLMLDICKADGMWWIRRQWISCALRLFGASSAKPQPEVEATVITAP